MNLEEIFPNKKIHFIHASKQIQNQNLELYSSENYQSKHLKMQAMKLDKTPQNSNIKDNNPININNLKANFVQYSKIKYGIDESGNPMNIKDYFKSINDSVYSNSNTSIFSGLTSMGNKIKRPIAYIMKDKDGNNNLIDLKGNIITNKNKEGDYVLPLELHVIIKDFDIKHPELRINGERHYDEKLEISDNNENEENSINIVNKNDNLNYKNDTNDKNEVDDLIYRTKTNIKNTQKNNNKNRILLRTHGILGLKHSPSPIRNNRINNLYKNPKYFLNNLEKTKIKKHMTKNRSFLTPKLRYNTFNSDFFSSKSNQDLLLYKEKNKTNRNIENKMQKIFSLNVIKKNKSRKRNNLIENMNIDCIINNTKAIPTNKNNKFYNSVNTIPKKMNAKTNIYKTNNSKKKVDNKTNKYFIMHTNKNYLNDKINKFNNNKENNNLIKRINKSKLITHSKQKKNNIFINLNQSNRIYNKNNVNINNNINISNSYISKKIKKIVLNEKNKMKNINKSERYYILSEEADNMIKSYSRIKIIYDNSKNIRNNNKILTHDNSLINFTYSRASPFNK